MKKNNEDQFEEEVEQTPGKIRLFFEYYKYVPGFKALVKLFLYFIFFTVIISVVACNHETVNESFDQEHKQEQVEKTYKEMLNDLINDNLGIVYNITINEDIYKINATRENNIMSGIYRTKEAIHEFRIQDNLIYEIGLNEEKETPELFKDINLTFLLPDRLVTVLESNKATKMLSDGNTIYNYEIDDTKYRVEVEKEIQKIIITNELSTYTIEYTKNEVNKS